MNGNQPTSYGQYGQYMDPQFMQMLQQAQQQGQFLGGSGGQQPQQLIPQRSGPPQMQMPQGGATGSGGLPDFEGDGKLGTGLRQAYDKLQTPMPQAPAANSPAGGAMAARGMPEPAPAAGGGGKGGAGGSKGGAGAAAGGGGAAGMLSSFSKMFGG